MQLDPIFSGTTLFACAFLGGGLCITPMGAMNSYYLNRLSKDLPWLVLCAVGSLAVILVLPSYFAEQLADGSVKTRDLRIGFRLAAFAVWGVVVLMHRAELRAQTQMGVDPRKPWLPAIIAIVLSTVVQSVLVSTVHTYSGVLGEAPVQSQETPSS